MTDKLTQDQLNMIEKLNYYLPDNSWSFIGSVEDFCILGSRFRKRPVGDFDIRIYTEDALEQWHIMFPDAMACCLKLTHLVEPKWRAYDGISNLKVEVFISDEVNEFTTTTLLCNGREVIVKHRTALDKIKWLQKALHTNKAKYSNYLERYKKYLPEKFPSLSLL